MKILLIAGHGAGDPGAAGNGYQEFKLTREVVDLLKNEFKKYVVDVDVYDKNRNAFYDVQNGTFKVGKYDYALEVHFNAFDDTSAHGTEIFITNVEKSFDVEKNIMQKMKKYFTLRDSDGVKTTNFLVITTLKNKGISSALLETCFITNKNDMKSYQANKKDIAKDIVEAIAASFKLPKVKEENKNTHVVKYLSEDKKEYYLNVYAQDKLEKHGYVGYYDYLLTIGTEGARNCFTGWNNDTKTASGVSKGTKSKGTKILVKKVATI